MGNKVLYWIMIVGIIVFAGFQLLLPEFADFPADLVKMAIGIIIFTLIDKFILKDIDTIEELKKGNIAYAMVISAFIIALLRK